MITKKNKKRGNIIMKDINRIKTFSNKLENVWTRCPHLTYSQVIRIFTEKLNDTFNAKESD